jgi:hypothetical protein
VEPEQTEDFKIGFDVDVGDQITTGMVTVPIGTPFAIEVEFSAFAGAGGTGGIGGITGEANTEFDNSLQLNPDSVFDLPTGYTANGGDIVDNRIISAIPLPAAVWLLGSGLLGLLGMARRKKV